MCCNLNCRIAILHEWACSMFTSHENENVNLIIMQLDSYSYIGTRTQYMHDTSYYRVFFKESPKVTG